MSPNTKNQRSVAVCQKCGQECVDMPHFSINDSNGEVVWGPVCIVCGVQLGIMKLEMSAPHVDLFNIPSHRTHSEKIKPLEPLPDLKPAADWLNPYNTRATLKEDIEAHKDKVSAMPMALNHTIVAPVNKDRPTGLSAFSEKDEIPKHLKYIYSKKNKPLLDAIWLAIDKHLGSQGSLSTVMLFDIIKQFTQDMQIVPRFSYFLHYKLSHHQKIRVEKYSCGPKGHRGGRVNDYVYILVDAVAPAPIATTEELSAIAEEKRKAGLI